MDLSGVARMVLMAQVGDGHGSDDQALRFAQQFPGRFVPFVAFQVPLLAAAGRAVQERWMHPDAAALTFLRETEDKLKTGKFFGLGEMIVRHYAYKTGRGDVAPEIDIQADSPLMHRFAQLAAQYRVPMLIHAEGEPLVVSAMERLLAAHADARVIWAHNCGRQSAEQIRRLLEHHSNLFCDLALMINQNGSYGSGWPRKEPWTFLIEDGSGHLFPEMKDLFEAFPDRFLGVGADVAAYDAWPRYTRSITRFRLLLSGLSPATAQRLAYENAEQVLGLPPATQ